MTQVTGIAMATSSWRLHSRRIAVVKNPSTKGITSKTSNLRIFGIAMCELQDGHLQQFTWGEKVQMYQISSEMISTKHHFKSVGGEIASNSIVIKPNSKPKCMRVSEKHLNIKKCKRGECLLIQFL